MGEWEPLVLFDTDDPEFTRGVQVGIVYALTRPVAEGEEPLHTIMVGVDTAEMLARLRDAGHVFTVEDNGPDWLAVGLPS